MRLAAIATSAVLALGLAACGGDDEEFSDVVPRSVPEVTVGENTGLPEAPAADDDEKTDTTSTTDTTDTTSTGAAPSTQAAPAAPTTTQAAPQTGGTPAQTTPQQQGNDGADSGGFSDFCAQNPGACPGE